MNYLQKIEFNKTRTTTEIFSDYWQFMKDEWRDYCLVLAVFVLPFSLVGAYFMTQQNFEILMFDGSDINMSYSDLYFALFCSLVAKFMGIFVSCAYVMKYMTGERFRIDSFLPFFSQYGLVALLATIVMVIALTLGFVLFVIPGIVLLPPMSILVYDVLITRNCFSSFTRCLNLCKTNWRQSFSVVMVCYLAIIVVSMFCTSLIPLDNSTVNIIVSAILTVLSETVMVPFILLYYSLANQNMRL